MVLGRGVLEEGDGGGHRAVQSGQAQAVGDGPVERGEVAVADEHLGAGRPQRLPVHQVHHPLGAVAAARGEDRRDGGVAPGVDEVAGAVGVGAREVVQVRVDVEDVRHDDRVQVPTAQDVHAGVQPLAEHRPAGRHDRHPVAGARPSGSDEGACGGAHSVSSSAGTSGRSKPNTWA